MDQNTRDCQAYSAGSLLRPGTIASSSCRPWELYQPLKRDTVSHPPRCWTLLAENQAHKKTQTAKWDRETSTALNSWSCSLATCRAHSYVIACEMRSRRRQSLAPVERAVAGKLDIHPYQALKLPTFCSYCRRNACSFFPSSPWLGAQLQARQPSFVRYF